jgi:soluble lytic murein transglycosylase
MPASRLSPLFFLLAVIFDSPAVFGLPVEQQRALFLKAEQAIKQDRAGEAETLAAGLADYPLYPHLLYQKLSKTLDDDGAVENFLARYPQTRLARSLRKRWLERLAAREEWGRLLGAYRETDDRGLQCAHGLALAYRGRRQEAFAVARKLWLSSTSTPAACERLFALWRSGPAFDLEQVWRRLGLALQKNALPLAMSLKTWLPPEWQAQADFWLQVHDNPRLILSCSLWNPKAPAAGRIFAHGVDRLASSEPLLAQVAWALNKSRFALDAEEIARIDRRTALGLAARRYAQAGAYLMAMPETGADAMIRGWRVRAALARGDWPGVLAAVEMLKPEEKNQAEWRYWRARALESLGDGENAQGYYRLAAEERDFYGFNAADRIGREYPLASQSAGVSAEDLNRLVDAPAFRAIRELRALDRESEARAEWLHAIEFLAPRDLVVAAKLAQQWGLDNLAINTAAKAGYWDDLELRFPLGFMRGVLGAAQRQQLDPSLVYALIRRESAFDPNAGSSAGARGLMQLMPATGEMMARRLGETPATGYSLLEPERNLRYGAAYFRGLLDKFGAHFALAAAAYNAGPGRVERWLPAHRPMPADLWVETIPFSETRQYVAAVAAYAVIYQSRLNQSPRRIAAWLPDVFPGPKAEIMPDEAVSIGYCE